MKKQAISYRRFSSRKQEQGDSLRRQLDKATGVCQRKKWELNEEASIVDAGKSASKGRHLKKGELGVFLQLCQAGHFQKGTVLIVEQLDRLSRLPISQTQELIKQILETGVEIYTCDPEMHLRRKDLDDIAKVIQLACLADAARRYAESLGERSAANWKQKRRRLKDGHKMTRRCKGWLKIDEDRTTFTVKPKAAQTIKLIFKMILEGGIDQIIKHFNETNIEHIKGEGHTWQRRYVHSILTDRSVLGEYRPTSKGKETGELIPDYYPQIIDEDAFNRANAAIAKRAKTGGPRGKKRIANLFTSLVYASDGYTCHLKANNPNRPLLVSSGAARKLPDAVYRSFPYQVFEQAVLLFCQDALPAIFDSGHRGKILEAIEAAQAELATITINYEKLKAKAATTGNIEMIMGMVDDLQEKKEVTEAKLAELEVDLANTTNGHLQDTLDLLSAMWAEQIVADAFPEDTKLTEIRTNLRAKLAFLIERIDIDVDPASSMAYRSAFIKITFTNGNARAFQVMKKHMNPDVFICTAPKSVELETMIRLSKKHPTGIILHTEKVKTKK